MEHSRMQRNGWSRLEARMDLSFFADMLRAKNGVHQSQMRFRMSAQTKRIWKIAARKDVHIGEAVLPVLASAAGTTDDNQAATMDEAISNSASKPRAQRGPRSDNGPLPASAQPVQSQAEI